jgi:hypothetical protein
MNGTAEEEQAEVAVLPVIDAGSDEILSAFTEVMLEWGHYRTAAGLRFPGLADVRRVAAGRRDDRGWNRSPIA